MEGVTFIKNLKSGTTEHHSLFADHDVLILPAKVEPFGYVLLEAISAGLCVVTTRATGASWIVEKSGGIVESTPEGAVKALFALTSKPDEIVNRMKECRNYKNQYHSNFQSFINEACPQ
jgi:glycosyltransferase involved in cell wall biosynthesis